MKRPPALALLVACVMAAALRPAAGVEPTFPIGSQIGMVPPPGLAASTSFPGFEDPDNSVFIRLIALPGNAYGEIEKTMTNDALRKQGMTVDKRENLTLPNGKGLLIAARQQADAVRLHKWLFVAPFGEITALVSFEVPSKAVARYPETTIRTAMATVAVRADVPDTEKLSLLPFKLGDLAGMRVVRVVPGVALQTRDRDQFARVALTGLPPLKDVRMVSAESMRIGGQPGHEIRAEGRSPQNDAEIEIVQWLRFGTGAYLRILGFGPKQSWTDHFTRFRAVRDGLEPR